MPERLLWISECNYVKCHNPGNEPNQAEATNTYIIKLARL